jgi:hypothetical protein
VLQSLAKEIRAPYPSDREFYKALIDFPRNSKNSEEGLGRVALAWSIWPYLPESPEQIDAPVEVISSDDKSGASIAFWYLMANDVIRDSKDPDGQCSFSRYQKHYKNRANLPLGLVAYLYKADPLQAYHLLAGSETLSRNLPAVAKSFDLIRKYHAAKRKRDTETQVAVARDFTAEVERLTSQNLDLHTEAVTMALLDAMNLEDRTKEGELVNGLMKRGNKVATLVGPRSVDLDSLWTVLPDNPEEVAVKIAPVEVVLSPTPSLDPSEEVR